MSVAPTPTLTAQQFQDAIAHLKQREGSDPFGLPLALSLPYDMYPGSYPGGVYHVGTKEIWDNYQWNPPQYVPTIQESEDDRSPKPTWDQLVDAAAQGCLTRLRATLTQEFRMECRRRITRGYGESTIQEESFIRMEALEAGAPQALTQQVSQGHTTRNTLRGRYAALKAWVETLDIETLENIDATSDEYWGDNWQE